LPQLNNSPSTTKIANRLFYSLLEQGLCVTMFGATLSLNDGEFKIPRINTITTISKGLLRFVK